jgi:hypothetical protein
VHVVSTGAAAFIVKDGVGYQLTDAQLAPIRSTPASGAALSGIDLHQWVTDPAPQPQTTVEGEAVDRVTGGVDPVAALNGIIDVAGQFAGGEGSSLRVTDADAPRVRAAAKHSTFEVTTAVTDHLLRSLTAEVDFEAPSSTASNAAAGALASELAKFGHLTLKIELRVERPNSAVAVAAPATVRPISAMPTSG